MSSTALFRTEAKLARGRIERSDPIQVDTSLGWVSLQIIDDLQSLEDVWEELQESAPCTGAQTFDWAKAWVRHVLGPAGREPVIAVGRGVGGKALFLWPFALGRSAGMKVLNWLGQEHANYAMGLFSPEAAAEFTREDIARLLGETACRTGVAAAILKGQPFTWDGIVNPFAKLPHSYTPSSGYAVRLGEFGTLYEDRFGKRSRHTLDRKERRLAETGALTYGWAETHDERLQVVDAFFAQKARQFAAMWIKDIFDTHARAFYREVSLLEGDNPGRLKLGYIKVNDAVLATFCGTICHKRMTVVLCSLTEGKLQRYSPGALLLRHQIKEACERGLAFYDFGAGEAAYKDQWANTVQPLFDSLIAFKPHGLILTLPLAVLLRLKRAVKSNRHLWPMAQKLRARLFGSIGTGA